MHFDNIDVVSRFARDCISNPRQILPLLQDARVAVKLIKCNFFTKSIDFLGHVIHPQGMAIATHTTAAVKEQKLSTNISELCSFSGLCKVFHSFVPNLMPPSAPLNKFRREISRNVLVSRQPRRCVQCTNYKNHWCHHWCSRYRPLDEVQARYRCRQRVIRIRTTTEAAWQNNQIG